MVRKHIRNWADCPIDDSVAEPSPTIPNTSNDDNVDNFQVLSRVFKKRNI